MSKYFDKKNCFLEPLVSEYGSSIVMTNVSKPSRTKYLNVDTRFTDDYTSSKNDSLTNKYVITFPEPINDVLSLKLVTLELPLSFNNVSSQLGNNNFLLTKTSDGTKTNINMIEYYHNYDSLRSLSLFTNLPIGITYIIDDSDHWTFTNTSTESYTLDFAVDPSGNFDKNQFKSKLGWLIGFRNDKYMLSPNTSLTGESFVNYSPTRYIYIVLDEFSNSFQNSFSSFYEKSIMNKKILAKLSLGDVNYQRHTMMSMNEYMGPLCSDIRKYSGKIDIKRINIELVNEWGKSLNMRGNDFSFLLKVEHE
jgi:hypothetical protein